MEPSAVQMMQAAQAALRDLVAPAVTDQWASSALRSVDVILSHLQARTAVEGPMLYQDNQDLAAVLDNISDNWAAHAMPELPAGVADFRAEAKAQSTDYPSVAALTATNRRGRSIIDELLLICHANPGIPAIEAIHQHLRDYLKRHLDRESPFFFPIFVGRPL